MGQNGGRRPGSGRPRVEFRWRRWAREAFSKHPEIQQNLIEAAKVDPNIALKLAEHGWGRPPQSLTVDSTKTERIEYVPVFPGIGDDAASLPVFSEDATVPGPGDTQ